jgi:hypothetical protein
LLFVDGSFCKLIACLSGVGAFAIFAQKGTKKLRSSYNNNEPTDDHYRIQKHNNHHI